MRAYLDTSVLVSYYTPEPRRNVVVESLRQVTDPAISLLCEAEFHSAIALKRKAGAAAAGLHKALDLLERHRRDGRFCVIALQQPHFADAIRLLDTVAVGLRTLDALHLAIARQEEVDLITADRRLSDAADEVGHPCIRLER